jgi:hypothetical protein
MTWSETKRRWRILREIEDLFGILDRAVARDQGGERAVA